MKFVHSSPTAPTVAGVGGGQEGRTTTSLVHVHERIRIFPQPQRLGVGRAEQLSPRARPQHVQAASRGHGHGGASFRGRPLPARGSVLESRRPDSLDEARRGVGVGVRLKQERVEIGRIVTTAIPERMRLPPLPEFAIGTALTSSREGGLGIGCFFGCFCARVERVFY